MDATVLSSTVLSSTFLLTLLLGVGLLFFIKASVKDRIQVVTLTCDQPEESLLTQLQQYFATRTYRVIALDAAQKQATFAGFVRPSWFLAIFLTGLAAVGVLCLALILSILIPSYGKLFLGLVLFSPLAGIFYWKKAGRQEQVSVKLEAIDGPGSQTQSLVTVTAHRDELATLKQTLSLRVREE